MSLRHGYQAETNSTAPRVMIRMKQFVKLSMTIVQQATLKSKDSRFRFGQVILIHSDPILMIF